MQDGFARDQIAPSNDPSVVMVWTAHTDMRSPSVSHRRATMSTVRQMPEVSRFYGIVITINFDDHLPPHFHARYGEHRAAIGLDGIVIAGRLPSRALRLVHAWRAKHQAELLDDWVRARDLRPLVPIAPLD